MHKFFSTLWLIWVGELPKGQSVEATVLHNDCCAFFPRCTVGARKGYIVGQHANDTVLLIHFDDGEYGVRPVAEVEHVWAKESV